jgi:hypothetical protein
MIKKGEYFRGRKYQALGMLLEHELDTFFQAEDVGASAGSKNDLLKYLQHEVSSLPKHIKEKLLMKLKANAQSKDTILAYIYNYILCCDGMRVI